MSARRAASLVLVASCGLAVAGGYAAASGAFGVGATLAGGAIVVALAALLGYRLARRRAAMATPPMAPADAAWLHMDEPNNAADIVLLIRFDELPTLAAIETTVVERLLRFDRFRQRVMERDGHPCWERDDELRVEDHVVRYAVDGPLTERRLADVVSELGSTPLAPGRPPWAVHLVQGSDGAGALVVRLHHCMGDGFALAHAIAFPEHAADDTPTAAPRRRRQLRAHLARALRHLLVIPFERTTMFGGTVTGRRRMAWSTGVSLERVKAVARARGATINDVLLTAITGALRSLLAERGELVDGRPLSAIVPVNLRPVRWIEEMDDSLGNRFGLVFLDLPVHEPTEAGRTRALRRGMDALKSSPEAAIAFGILNALGHGPARLEHLVTHLFARRASLVISNVPGPRAPVYFGGARVRQVMFWEPHPGRLGLAVSLLTYDGTVAMGARSDAGIIAEPRRLVELFDAELARILAEPRAVGEARRASAAAGAAALPSGGVR